MTSGATARKILVTGSSGFVGQALLPTLRAAGFDPNTPSRQDIGDLGPGADWRPFLFEVDTVIHLAARAHTMEETAADPAAAFDRINHLGTARLAGQAAAAGVGRFVFLSSVKVHGDESKAPLTPRHPTAPADPYGCSKLAAERALTRYSGRMNVVILRPPLVYGPGVKGNFLSLLRLADRGLPLPLGGLRNKRSLIYVGNLADAILAALRVEPGIYLPSDHDDVSTSDLIRRVADALDRPARLFRAPPRLLRCIAGALGRGPAIERLLGSLTVDGAVPGWNPAYLMQRGLADTAHWYRRLGDDARTV